MIKVNLFLELIMYNMLKDDTRVFVGLYYINQLQEEMKCQ